MTTALEYLLQDVHVPYSLFWCIFVASAIIEDVTCLNGHLIDEMINFLTMS